YAKLPAGDYRFETRTADSEGVWSAPNAVLIINVPPFYWQTWWFQLLVVTAFTLMVAGLVRYASFRRLQLRLRSLEREAALDKERARIARDIHDDLGGSLTEISMLTELAFRESAGQEIVGERGRQVINKMRQVADSVDGIIWAISQRNDA